MKKLRIFIVVIFFGMGCRQAYQNSAQLMVTKYLDSINGSNNRKTIAFDTLREYRLTWEQSTPEGAAADSLRNIYIDSAAHDITNIRYLDTINRLIKLIETNNASYKASAPSTGLKAIYQYKIAERAWQTDTAVFIFDAGVRHIIKTLQPQYVAVQTD